MEQGSGQSNPCAICLSDMGSGGGQAIFTAECSHTFHFQCISSSVAHGHLVCPLCNAQWRQLPFQRPAEPSPPMAATPQHRQDQLLQQQQQQQQLRQQQQQHLLQQQRQQLLQQQQQLLLQQQQQLQVRLQPMHHVQPQRQAWQPQVFDDDDETVEQRHEAEEGAPGGRGTLVVTTHTEFPAIARGSSHEDFATLVHIKAPGIAAEEGTTAQRAPLDLVTVLDVSGSMAGEKLALLKQAMGFVIDNLGPCDRLSVVSFSYSARRETRLLRMSGDGKAQAKRAVESLVARGGTNIANGLQTAAKVLDERRHRNAVASVVLLSDGQDNHTMQQHSRPGAPPPNYEALVPASFTGGGDWTAPVHTFGFGNDHDAAAMHVVAEATGGTFSYIENEAVVQDSFAQCIGGLLTVVVQEARLSVECVDPGVRIVSIKSGRYESRVDDDGRAASVRVGELYADEERRFLLFLTVPPVVAEAEGASTETITTTLIKVSCSYRDAAGGNGMEVNVASEDMVVTRPEELDPAERSVEVVRERVRVEATDDIAAARAAAERGAFQEAVNILENRERAVAESVAAIGGDNASLHALRRELQEMLARVASGEEYARSGRALMLSGMNMMSAQRANSRQLLDAGMSMQMNSAPAVSNGATSEAPSYATPAMRAMLLRSRRAREAAAEEQQPALLPPPRRNAGEAAPSSGPVM